MEKSEKKSKLGKCVLWTVLSYLVISVLMGICSVLRNGLEEGSTTEIVFMFFEFALVPILFYVAGYVGTKKFDLEKFKIYKVCLIAIGFSGVLLLLWYVFLELYVLLNLPAAEGSIGLDMFLRKITVMVDYTVLYMEQTDLYKFGILPGIHCLFRVLYWILYYLGNRKYALAQAELQKAKKRR